MGFLLFLLVIAAAVAVFFWFRKDSAAKAITQPRPVSNRFHAVTISVGQGACPAVQALAKSRFLAKEAPRLPLDECTAAACHCAYKHHDDRRDDEDRREEPISVPPYEGEQRRRAREDRRKSK